MGLGPVPQLPPNWGEKVRTQDLCPPPAAVMSYLSKVLLLGGFQKFRMHCVFYAFLSSLNFLPSIHFRLLHGNTSNTAHPHRAVQPNGWPRLAGMHFISDKLDVKIVCLGIVLEDPKS